MPDLKRLPWHLRYVRGRNLSSMVRQLAVRLTHGHATVRFGRGCHIGPGFSLWVPSAGSLIVGDAVEFRRGFTCEISGDGRVTIGDGCVFTYDTIIQCSTTIDIGPRCLIGRATIADGNHRFRDPHRPIPAQGYDYRPITIGAETAIMSNVTVVNSVGRRAVVGAGSVVTRPIPDYSLAVGAPARVVERYGPEEAPASTPS